MATRPGWWTGRRFGNCGSDPPRLEVPNWAACVSPCDRGSGQAPRRWGVPQPAELRVEPGDQPAVIRGRRHRVLVREPRVEFVAAHVPLLVPVGTTQSRLTRFAALDALKCELDPLAAQRVAPEAVPVAGGTVGAAVVG